MMAQKGHFPLTPTIWASPMTGPDQDSVFDEIAGIIRYVEYRSPKLAAKKLRQAAKLLTEVSGIISRLPDNFALPVPLEEAEALIQTRKEQAGENTPMEEVAWALDKIQSAYPRPIARKLGRASKLIQEASELGGQE